MCSIMDIDTVDNNLSCPICMDVMCEPFKTQCGHAFCRTCIYRAKIISPDGQKCPICRQGVAIEDSHGEVT